MWVSGKHIQKSCLVTLFTLTRPLTLQAETLTIRTHWFISAAADFPDPALVTHCYIHQLTSSRDRNHPYPCSHLCRYPLASLKSSH